MQADDLPPPDMSLETALQLLGVREGASFDEIIRAKKVVMDKHGGDEAFARQVEAAYDILLMQSLSRRRAGKIVDKSVRFADVPPPPTEKAQNWLNKTLSGTPVSVGTMPQNDAVKQAAVFAGLAVWTLVGGMGSSEFPAGNGSDIPGLQLALALGASIYFLRQQKVGLGKAVGLSVTASVLGALLGSLVEAWLRVDIIPVFGVSSPAVVVSEFTYLTFWLISAYLR